MKALDTSAVQALLQLSGLTTHSGDADALAELWSDHLKAVERLFEVDTAEVGPAVTFDAGWG